jgi:deazaflavin-dependent oxidoreductase (nitroreductase family)
LRTQLLQTPNAKEEAEMADWDPAAFTKALIADIREHDGNVTTGPMAGRPLLILTTTGAKTGQERVSVVTYSRDGDAYVVAASKGGMPDNPAWFANLVANPTVTIEAEGKVRPAKAQVAEGADRDALWDRHVEAHPAFGEYPAKTGGRVIPMIRLTPIG